MNLFKKVQIFFSTLWDAILCRRALTHRKDGIGAQSRVDDVKTLERKHTDSVEQTNDFVEVSLDANSSSARSSTIDVMGYETSRRPGKSERIHCEWILPPATTILPVAYSNLNDKEQALIELAVFPDLKENGEATALPNETSRNDKIVKIEHGITNNIMVVDIDKNYDNPIEGPNQEIYGCHIKVQEYEPFTENDPADWVVNKYDSKEETNGDGVRTRKSENMFVMELIGSEQTIRYNEQNCHNQLDLNARNEANFDVATKVELKEPVNFIENKETRKCQDNYDSYDKNQVNRGEIELGTDLGTKLEDVNGQLQNNFVTNCEENKVPNTYINDNNRCFLDDESTCETKSFLVDTDKVNEITGDSLVDIKSVGLYQAENVTELPLSIIEQNINLQDTDREETSVDRRRKFELTTNDSEEAAHISDNTIDEIELIELCRIDKTCCLLSENQKQSNYRNKIEDERSRVTQMVAVEENNMVINENNAQSLDDNTGNCSIIIEKRSIRDSHKDDSRYVEPYHDCYVEEQSTSNIPVIIHSGMIASTSWYFNDRLSPEPSKQNVLKEAPLQFTSARDSDNMATTSFCQSQGEFSGLPLDLTESDWRIGATTNVVKSDSLSNFLPAVTSENAEFSLEASSSDSASLPGIIDDCGSRSRVNSLQEMMCTSKGVLRLSSSFDNFCNESNTSLDDFESPDYKNVEDASDISTSVISSQQMLDIPNESSLEAVESNSSNVVDLISGWAISFEGPLNLKNDGDLNITLHSVNEKSRRMTSSFDVKLSEVVDDNPKQSLHDKYGTESSEKAGDCDYSETEKFMNDVNAALNKSLTDENNTVSQHVASSGDVFTTNASSANQNGEDWFHSMLVELIEGIVHSKSMASLTSHENDNINPGIMESQLNELQLAETSGMNELKSIVEEVLMNSFEKRQSEDLSMRIPFEPKHLEGISQMEAAESSSIIIDDYIGATSEKSEDRPTKRQETKDSPYQVSSICDGPTYLSTLSDGEGDSQIRLIEKISANSTEKKPSAVSCNSQERCETFEKINESESITTLEDYGENRPNGPTGDGIPQSGLPEFEQELQGEPPDGEEPGTSNTLRRKRNRRRKKKSN